MPQPELLMDHQLKLLLEYAFAHKMPLVYEAAHAAGYHIS